MPESPMPQDDVARFIAQRAKESPDIDTSGIAIFGRISRIENRLRPHVVALFARHGLERGEFDVLATLQRGGPPYRLRPTEIFRDLMVSSGGLTHRLKRLVAAGLVKRVPAENDARSTLVELTEKGQEVTRRAFEEDMAMEAAWLAALTEAERRVLANLLSRLCDEIPEHERS